MKKNVKNVTYSEIFFKKNFGYKRREQRIRSLKQETYQMFIKNLADGINIIDVEKLMRAYQELLDTVRYQQGMTFKVRKINGRFIHTLCEGQLLYKFGLTPEQVVGKELYDFLPYEMALSNIKYYDLAWNSEENVSFEGTLNEMTFLASLKPIKDINGSVAEIIASCVDISERKLIENELFETEEKYRCLIENTLVGVFCSKMTNLSIAILVLLKFLVIHKKS